ncbi:MAG: hypothetical protein IPK80_01490 [Nannocystis sp.]|nr:hypothetical protein [Nannocystis sp.]
MSAPRQPGQSDSRGGMARLERLVPPALRDSSDTLRRGLLLSGLALA